MGGREEHVKSVKPKARKVASPSQISANPNVPAVHMFIE